MINKEAREYGLIRSRAFAVRGLHWYVTMELERSFLFKEKLNGDSAMFEIGSKLVTECIRFIDSQLKDGWRIKIVLVSAKGKENFYEKFGFKYRPDDTYGAGMDLWRGI